MSQPKYYDLSGKEVTFYHPVDALEALELGVVVTKPGHGTPTPKAKEAPAPEEVKEETPAIEPDVSHKKAPRRRLSE